MSTITASGRPSVATRQVPGFIKRCWDALQERRKRTKLRAALYGLSGHDLHDIGIAHGDIEFVAANPDIDPRASDAARCRTSHGIALMSYCDPARGEPWQAHLKQKCQTSLAVNTTTPGSSMAVKLPSFTASLQLPYGETDPSIVFNLMKSLHGSSRECSTPTRAKVSRVQACTTLWPFRLASAAP